jgi:hypothetical protein
MPNVGQELLNVPLPEMVTKLALGIAESQTKLDLNSTEVAKFMSTTTVALPDIADTTKTKDFALISLGFFPGFYQFTEASIEVKMAITMTTSSDVSIGVTAKAGFGCFSASVNASYSSKYSYSVDGSSVLRVKLAPVPPPQILTDYMEALIAKMKT